MIKKKTILFKLCKIKLTDKQLFDSMHVSYEVCPSCGAIGCCEPHGSYKRDLISINNSVRTDDVIYIRRVKCTSCKSTHALLSDILIPYGSYSLRFVLYVLRAYLYRRSTVNALCSYFCIAVATLYKWIHLFNKHANLLLNATMQISWVTAPALDFIEEITALPSQFFKQYNFSFLQNTKQRILVLSPG